MMTLLKISECNYRKMVGAIGLQMAGQMCHGAPTQCVQTGQRDLGGGATQKTMEEAPRSSDFMIGYWFYILLGHSKPTVMQIHILFHSLYIIHAFHF